MKENLEFLIKLYSETVKILRENAEKDNSPISVAIRGRHIEVLDQVIFDLEELKNYPNESKTVNRNENAEKFYCYKCDTELIPEIHSHDLYCPKCNK